MNTMWGRVSPTEYVNSDLGRITFDGYGWMVVPQLHIVEQPKRFANLKAAKDWLELFE